MSARSLGQLRPTQHARNFLSALFASNQAHRRTRAVGRTFLFDQIIMVGKSGNLRQASYARHLTSPRQCLQLLGRVPRSLPLFGKGRVNDAIPRMNLRAAARREHRPFRKNRKSRAPNPNFHLLRSGALGGKGTRVVAIAAHQVSRYRTEIGTRLGDFEPKADFSTAIEVHHAKIHSGSRTGG